MNIVSRDLSYEYMGIREGKTNTGVEEDKETFMEKMVEILLKIRMFYI